MNVPFPVILAALAATLGLGIWAVRELVAGWEFRQRLAARSALDEVERRTSTLSSRLDRFLLRTETGRRLGRRLAAADLRIRVSTFLCSMVAAMSVVIYLIGHYLAPLFGFAAAGGVAALFFAYLRRREERRKEAFIAQLPELARVLSNASSAGLVPRTAIDLAAEEMAEPAKTELRRTSEALKLGQSLDDALRELGERLPSRELAVLISTLIVSARAGGSLITALRNISTTLEDRKEIRREVKTIMGEAVVTNWFIAALGVFALVLLNIMQPGALRAMSGELLGQVILAGAFGMFIVSFLIIRKITRIDV